LLKTFRLPLTLMKWNDFLLIDADGLLADQFSSYRMLHDCCDCEQLWCRARLHHAEFHLAWLNVQHSRKNFNYEDLRLLSPSSCATYKRSQDRIK